MVNTNSFNLNLCIVYEFVNVFNKIFGDANLKIFPNCYTICFNLFCGKGDEAKIFRDDSLDKFHYF